MYIEQCEHFQSELKIPPQMERNYFVFYSCGLVHALFEIGHTPADPK